MNKSYYCQALATSVEVDINYMPRGEEDLTPYEASIKGIGFHFVERGRSPSEAMSMASNKWNDFDAGMNEDIQNYLDSLKQVRSLYEREQDELDRHSDIVLKDLKQKYQNRILTRELTEAITREFGNQIRRLTAIPFIVSSEVDRAGKLSVRALRKP